MIDYYFHGSYRSPLRAGYTGELLFKTSLDIVIKNTTKLQRFCKLRKGCLIRGQ